MDGNQAREALVGEAEAFHEEQQLRGATRVLHHVEELLPAQDVNVALAEEGVCRGWTHVRTPSHQEVRELGGMGRVTGPLDTERCAVRNST